MVEVQVFVLLDTDKPSSVEGCTPTSKIFSYTCFDNQRLIFKNMILY